MGIKHECTKRLIALAAVVVLGALASCGEASKTHGKATTVAATTVPYRPGDPLGGAIQSHSLNDANDADNDASNGNDDLEEYRFGKAASAAQVRTIIALLARYYSAEAHDNGTTVCALIYSLMAEAIVEDFGGVVGPASLRGKTCAVVETKAYKLDHKLAVAKAMALEVLDVRVDGKKGLAILRFGSKAPLRYISLHLEFGVWKVYAISDDIRLP